MRFSTASLLAAALLTPETVLARPALHEAHARAHARRALVYTTQTVVDVSTSTFYVTVYADDATVSAAPSLAASKTVSSAVTSSPVVPVLVGDAGGVFIQATPSTNAPPARPTNSAVKSTSWKSVSAAKSTSQKSVAPASKTNTASAAPSPSTQPIAVGSSNAGGKRGLNWDKGRGPAWTNTLLSPAQGGTVAGSKVSWAYDWSTDPMTWTGGVSNFVPMKWDATDDSTWDTAIQKAIKNGSPAMLGMNEPDQCGGYGTCTSVTDTITAWKKFMSPYKGQIDLVSPAVTNGVGTGIGFDFLSKMMAQCPQCASEFSAVAIHWYGGADADGTNFKTHVTQAIKLSPTGKVWITEFAPQGGTLEQYQTWLKVVIPWLDSNAGVVRYAYEGAFEGGPEMFITNGKPNALGQLYATI